jgi:hypothetical protein
VSGGGVAGETKMAEPVPDFQAKPDYAFWSQMATWKVEQLPALLLDRDPHQVTWETVQTDACPADLKAQYTECREIIENHQQSGRLAYITNPGDVLSWAKSNGFSYPQALEDAVRAKGSIIADWKTENQRLATENEKLKAENQRLVTALENAKVKTPPEASQKWKSLLTMLYAMATEKYGYDPTAKRNRATKDIAGATARTEISVTDDTVRAYLEEAVELQKKKANAPQASPQIEQGKNRD